jgi:hypothetical protein
LARAVVKLTDSGRKQASPREKPGSLRTSPMPSLRSYVFVCYFQQTTTTPTTTNLMLHDDNNNNNE